MSKVQTKPSFKVLINTKGEKIGIIFLNHAYTEALYNSTEMVQFLTKAVEAAGEEYPSYQLFLGKSGKDVGNYFLVAEPYDTEEFWMNAEPVASIKYYEDDESYSVKLWTGVKV